jgi:carbon storage regulator
MLVLSRKINERIIIGENVELEVLAIRGGVARLGIKAPRDVSVVRTELSEEVISDSVKRGNSLCAVASPGTGPIKEILRG